MHVKMPRCRLRSTRARRHGRRYGRSASPSCGGAGEGGPRLGRCGSVRLRGGLLQELLRAGEAARHVADERLGQGWG